jgi:type IV pilus assembly protein PilY1
MNINKPRLGALLVGAVWMLTAGLPAVADDTELFVATSFGAGIRPNILFIIDNSGSMAANVVTQAAYDPLTSYGGDCEADRVYWRTGTGDPPECDATDRWFDLSALKCDAAVLAFESGGQFVDKLVQYDHSSDRRWERIDRDRKSRPVECQADAGVHGWDDMDPDLYADDGTGVAADAWGNAGSEISWNATHNSQRYTLYSGNYLNWAESPAIVRTRLEIVQDVSTALIDSINGVNVGLMYFNDFENNAVGSQGGLVAHAMENVATARAAINAKINALTPETFTPLSETLYEAAQYYAGRKVVFGDPNSIAASRAAGDPSVYASPINDTCQQNYVVFLTDGEPTLDVAANAAIPAMTDHGSESFGSLVGATCDVENNANGMCLDDLAHFMNEGDSSTLPGSQSVKTYTIGFTVDLPVLAQTAQRGGGSYYTADDTAELSNALTNILIDILDTNQTFSSPSVAVNAFNRTQNLSDLFISVFSPTGQEHWHGNLKKYRLRPSDATIVDANGAPAVDPATGFFTDGSQSYWSAPVVDGGTVTDGGAANVLPVPAARTIFTYLGANSTLSHASNLFAAANLGLTDAHLDISGIMGEPTRDEVIRYVRGEDFNDWNTTNGASPNRNQIGDPLHSQPVSAIYGPGQRDGLLFLATNDGMLHALDLETGVEQWAFIPPEFLDDQVVLYGNDTTANKHYGIDGDLRVHMIGDHDNLVEAGERVFLYFGMGRGGDFYYALDITSPTAPKLQWSIGRPTLTKLGQSWSTPIPTRMDIQGAAYHVDNVDKHVLVIGGGYEPDQDFETFSTDTSGNALYIVDAYSGALLWSASNAGASQNFATVGRSMDYSIPARIRVVDFDGDGFADRLYAGDMGGQIWRFDVSNGQPPASLVAGGVIAQLGAAPNALPTADMLRRFYYTPDIATVNTRTENFIHIGIGSGHRGHPLNMTNRDRFYALRDYNVQPMSQAAFNALIPVTDAMLTPITTTNTAVNPGSPGWRLDLNVGTGWIGEKVLAEARTFNNQVIFSTFRPGASGAAVSCTPQLGTNRVYQMNIFNGAPVTNLDGPADNSPLTMSDLYLQRAGGILSTAQALFVDSDSDNDGIADAEEDADGDGIPDEIDSDDDGDGIADDAEDRDGDGIPDVSDPDVDGDGIANVDEDDDGDGVANRLDADDDGDGILDIDEEDDTPVICVGLICFPAGFQNTPVRTFWTQEIVD